MFEIHSKKRDRKKDVLYLIVIIVVFEILIYFITVFFEAPMEVFYALTSLILVFAFAISVTMLPQRLIINEEKEIVSLCFKKLCISTLYMRNIYKIIYEVDINGKSSLLVFGAPYTTDMVISTPDFSERDIRSAFERLSDLSEKYGFDVEERYESETSSLSSPSESSVPSEAGVMEISEDEIIPSEDLTPYRVK